ncbi:hypothetical protein [Leucobacter aridicollis]|uniref:Uncharacterized protein n=1 Tax=Leucobacter aridicollis TaxID=283878 RepID=A0A852R0I8_9MICO|nr:hypothetical protein [Leucobacter aridicollis]MBL3682631.1 hypothetical protein [Leucobacter aridicollis]NYD26057.1 hypothetical protein [Leucobacter aridicollis]
MTAPDVRTAAQEQYRRENWPTSRDDYWSREQAFVAGAVWGAALVTPTREQIAEALYNKHPRAQTRPWSETPRMTREIYLEDADAVLALIEGAAAG